MTVSPEQNELLERLKAGDVLALSGLIKEYQLRVYTYCSRMLPYSDAEDAAQEVFIKLYKNIGSFKGDCSLSTFIYTITVNCCRDILRKEKRKSEYILQLIDGEDEPEVPDLFQSPEDYVEKEENMDAIKLGLKVLPDEYREVLLLRAVNGLSYEEISKISGISDGVVKSRLFRARRALKKFLEKNTNFFGNESSNQNEKV